jgi:hypothetical protein
LKNIKELLIIDTFIQDKTENANENQKKSPFLNFLLQIIINKYNALFQTKNKKNKAICYINKGEIESHDNSSKIYDIISKNETTRSTLQEKDHSLNSFFNIYSRLRGPEKINTLPIKIIKSFLISVYIYYQNKNNPLIKPLKEDENNKIFSENCLKSIPFTYDLNGACIEGRFANIITSPIKIEPRIEKINIRQNNLKETALFEIAKSLIFNQNIKKIEYNISIIKSFFLDYFNYGLGLFDNHTLEQINLSYNYIKEDGDFYLAKLLSHLKGLKTINLTANDIKCGISSFFIMLKKLYRQGKSNVEYLYLTKCYLDDTSLYELGELLKSKYCKLKCVFLSINNKPNNFNLLKKIKKNRSLVEINFGRSTYGDIDIDDINRVISNTNLRHLSFFRNKFTDFNDLIRIIYRTKLIKDKGQKPIVDNEIPLLNLDLSNNDPWIQYSEQVKLIDSIIDETTLGCLDISHIIYGPNPDKSYIKKNKAQYENYVTAVDDILKKITNQKKEHEINMKEKRSVECDKKKFENIEKDEGLKKMNEKFKDKIDEIIKDENSLYPIFLKEEAEKILNEINKDQEKYSEIINKLYKNNEDKNEEDKNEEDKNEEVKKEEDKNEEDKNKEENSKKKVMEKKIVNYLTFRRAENELIKINKKLDEKKLIII